MAKRRRNRLRRAFFDPGSWADDENEKSWRRLRDSLQDRIGVTFKVLAKYPVPKVPSQVVQGWDW